MRKFRRRGAVISTQLSREEIVLLRSLLSELVELLQPDDGGSDHPETSEAPDATEATDATGATENPAGGDDPFAAWAADFAADTRPVEAPTDPVLRRLFPNAYADDPDAAAEFRRFTERDLRSKKIADAAVALEQLDACVAAQGELRIPTSQADAWLRTLTSLRLSLATRLGIEDAAVADSLAALPDDDPRAFLASVYDWLGFAQETLVLAL